MTRGRSHTRHDAVHRYGIIGVMRRDFVFRNRDSSFWTPVSFTPRVVRLVADRWTVVVCPDLH